MRRSNAVVAGGLTALIVTMTGVSFAAVPLYRMFCQWTGYDGTPRLDGARAPGGAGDRIEVRFDANTSPALPWRFTADRASLLVTLGENELAGYSGRNQAERPVTGVATYNITPEKAAKYFHKTACFCFDEQTLQPGQQTSFPLSFWVDPAIRSDPDTRDLRTVTLSYTFFRSLDDAARNGGIDRAGPHVGASGDAVSALNTSRISR